MLQTADRAIVAIVYRCCCCYRNSCQLLQLLIGCRSRRRRTTK